MTVRLKISVGVSVALVVMAAVAGFVAGRYWSDNRKPNFTEKCAERKTPCATMWD